MRAEPEFSAARGDAWRAVCKKEWPVSDTEFHHEIARPRAMTDCGRISLL